MTNKIIKESIIKSRNSQTKKSMINIFENKSNYISKNNNIELPSINRKNQSNNCQINKKNLFIKKLVFNPISYEYKNKIKKSLFSPVPYSPIKKNRNYSSIDLKPLPIRQLQPLNLNRSSSEIKLDKKPSMQNISQNRGQVSTNIISDNNKEDYNRSIDNDIKYKKMNIKIIDFLTKYNLRGNKDNALEKNKYKYIYNSKHIQEFKRSILELYNRIEDTKRKYLDNENFINYFLDKEIPHYKKSISGPNKKSIDNISYDYNINEIKPKYEYIDYFGKENKIITKLTTNITKKDIEDKNNDEKNNLNLKLNNQLRVPKLIALKEFEDYKNKNYIKILQNKKLNEKMLEEQEENKKRKIMSNSIKINQKGFEKMKNSKINNFSGLIDNVVEQHNSVMKKLKDIIEVDRKQYEKDFNEIKLDINIK